jgi:predicted PurR-regulated permease PerM
MLPPRDTATRERKPLDGLWRFALDPDVRGRQDALGYSLSRYLGGVAVLCLIEGALSTLTLVLLGVPYALALGAWAAVTAAIPYVGTWIGLAPALLVALTVSPLTALLALVLYNVIWNVQGTLITPRIQGRNLGVHPVLVFLAVVVGGGLAGLAGALLALPTLAVLRVLFDFLRVRLTTED